MLPWWLGSWINYQFLIALKPVLGTRLLLRLEMCSNKSVELIGLKCATKRAFIVSIPGTVEGNARGVLEVLQQEW